MISSFQIAAFFNLPDIAIYIGQAGKYFGTDNTGAQ